VRNRPSVRRVPRGFLLGAGLLLSLAQFRLLAQTSGTGALRGRVTDTAGAPLPGVAVTVRNDATGLVRTVTTREDGLYNVPSLPLTGRYTVAFTLPGFQGEERTGLVLTAGETASIHAVLKAAGVASEITVLGTVGGIRSDEPTLGIRLDSTKIEETPNWSNKLTSLPLLDSAVRPAKGTGDVFLNETLVVFQGSGRRQISWGVDGSPVNDSWGRQTIFATLPLPAVQEMTVMNLATSAEWGRTTGGVVNVITKSGTNDFHGDFPVTIRPGALEASAPVTGADLNDALVQGGGVLSGPLVTDRLQVLVGGEITRQRRDSQITSAYEPGIYTGHFDQELFLVKLDATIDDRNSAQLRFNLDTFDDTNPSDVVGGTTLPSAGRAFTRNTYTGMIGENAILSPNLFNEARAALLVGSPITQFYPTDDSSQYVRPGVATEGESRWASLMNHQYQISDSLTVAAGPHTIRAGGDAVYSSSGGYGQEFGTPFYKGQFTFRTNIPPSTPTSSLTIADVTKYTQGFGDVAYNVRETNWSLFAQDDFRPLSGLSINLGLRYDRQTLTDATTNFSPRAGVVWTPGKDGKTAVRGSFGVYYSEIPANTQATWSLGGPEGIFTYTAAPGQTGFPTSLEPLPGFPPGAVLPARDITIRPGMADYYNQFFDTSKLLYYPDSFTNPKTLQAALGVEREVAPGWFVAVDGLSMKTTGIVMTLDENAPTTFVRTAPGQTLSASAADATRPIVPVDNGYRRIFVTTNLGEAKYDGLQVNVRKSFGAAGSVLLSYTWSHARNNVEPDAPSVYPNDTRNLGAEWADSLLDQRQRLVLSGWAALPWEFRTGGTMTIASGRPYNITTGVDNNGDASSTDRPIVDGALLGRNAGRGHSTFDLSLFLERSFALSHAVNLVLRAEGLNLTNHANVYGYNGTYGNSASGVPLPTLGQPLGGISNVDPPREFQFQIRVQF